MRICSIALLVAAGGVAQTATAQTAQPRIAGIEARLLYERTGALSGNILPPATFSGHNTILGEGDAREPADDILVTVDLTAAGDDANSDAPLVIVVKGSGGKVLARRTIGHHYFTKGHSRRSLLVQDATCAGKLVIEASLGQQKKTSQIELNCGE